MNTIEYVKLTTDTNYIPVKYAVMEATVGSSLGNSYVWLKCVSNGIATKADLDSIKNSVETFVGPDKTKIVGTLGSYSVSSIDKIAPYTTPAHYSDAGLLLG